MHESSLDLWDLPVSLRTLVENELEEGEEFVWIGVPDPKRFARQAIPIVLFAIPWTAFAVFWIFGASGFKIPDFTQGFDFFPLFGVPFVLIGLGMLSSPFWIVYKAKRTVYVLTNQRALIFDGGWSTTIRSFFPDQFNNLTLARKQYPNGSGDLMFEPRLVFKNNDENSSQQTIPKGFLAIPHVKEVEKLVRELAKSAEDEK